MCNKAVANHPHALQFVLECYKTHKMCDKAVDTYLSAIKFVPEFFMTHQICNKAVNKCFLSFDSIPHQYKTQEMCDRVVTEVPFFVYCHDKYMHRRMCDEAVDDSLALLKLITD